MASTVMMLCLTTLAVPSTDELALMAAFDGVQGVFRSAENITDNQWLFFASLDGKDEGIVASARLEVVTDNVIRGIGLKVTLPKTVTLHFNEDQRMISKHEEWWYEKNITHNKLNAVIKYLHGTVITLFAKT